MKNIETRYKHAIQQAARAAAILEKIAPLEEAANDREDRLSDEEWMAEFGPGGEMNSHKSRARVLALRRRRVETVRRRHIEVAIKTLQSNPDSRIRERMRKMNSTRLYAMTFQDFVLWDVRNQSR